MTEPDRATADRLSPLEREILSDFQRDFPLSPRPYAEIAARLGCDEAMVLATLGRFIDDGLIARVGPVFAPHRVGWSTLAAMAVPDERLEEVAALVSARPEINHNYERCHRFNLWFVVTAEDRARTLDVLDDIAKQSGLEVLDLPLEQAFHIDLGFPLEWH
jgi:siroheme decarboxylase